jgi:hypothetical protein
MSTDHASRVIGEHPLPPCDPSSMVLICFVIYRDDLTCVGLVIYDEHS